jgi:hypothetical protein
MPNHHTEHHPWSADLAPQDQAAEAFRARQGSITVPLTPDQQNRMERFLRWHRGL